MATSTIPTQHPRQAFRRLLLCQTTLLILVSFAWLPVFAANRPGTPGEVEAPNVVFILADDKY